MDAALADAALAAAILVAADRTDAVLVAVGPASVRILTDAGPTATDLTAADLTTAELTAADLTVANSWRPVLPGPINASLRRRNLQREGTPAQGGSVKARGVPMK